MKRFGPSFVALCLGLILGSVVPALVGAAPRVGDAKFESQFIKTFAASPEKPLIFRTHAGEFQVVGVVGVEDDFIIVQLKSKDPAVAHVRIHDIVAVSQPTN
jgi:hypothetical protein